ncbi:MAG: DUF3426 domain-containing protein [Halofilum sp. (in: g-proteobacteria)]|nr:DUF3426 domain-containing protein [Halofilum sp. (in: g-proteobacteria)]
MNTQCPHCRTVFRIAADVLDEAGGRVRCGQCGRAFDARSRLQKELPFDASATVDQPAGGDHGTRTPDGAQPPHQPRLQLEQPRRSPVSGILMSDLEGEPERHTRGRPSRWSLAGWSAVNTLLLVALCAQLLFVQREAFAQNPSMRPLIVDMCAYVGCSIAPRRAVEQIELVRRNVYAHPNVENALIIDARFVNNARFSQPYPTLTVSLGDLRGDPIIRRNFEPREYRPELDPNARMAPGSPVRITLEVRDPGREARTFELDFS